MKEIEPTDKIEIIPASSIEIKIQEEVLDSAFTKNKALNEVDIDRLLRRFSYLKSVWEVK